MPVDTSGLHSNDSIAIIEAIENQGHHYASVDVTAFATNLYSGSKADIADTEVYSDAIDLSEEVAAAIDIVYTPSGNTDALVISFYKRRDEDFDGTEIAFYSATMAKLAAEKTYHYSITPAHGRGFYRVGLKSSGATDTIDAAVYVR